MMASNMREDTSLATATEAEKIKNEANVFFKGTVSTHITIDIVHYRWTPLNRIMAIGASGLGQKESNGVKY